MSSRPAFALETPQQAARRLAAKQLQNGFRPKALHVYEDADGKPLYWRMRLEHPETGEKWIRPIRLSETMYEIGEPDFQGAKPLYRLSSITKHPEDEVWITEGENCADALAEVGIVATTSGGAGSASTADLKPLSRRSVIVWPDNDDAGQRYAQEVVERLQQLDCDVQCVDVDKLNLPDKGDCVDWLTSHPEATRREVEALPRVSRMSGGDSGVSGEKLEDWPDPEPIITELRPVEAMPLAIIPEPYQPWLKDIAHRMQCPLDFLAAGAMGVTGAVVGAGCGIKPKTKDDWLAVPNLWGGVVGRPSILKTPALAEVTRPLARLESEAKEAYDDAVPGHQAEIEVHKAKKEALRADMLKAAKGKSGDKPTPDLEKIKQAFVKLSEPAKLIWRRYKTNDATIEKVSELLAENPRGLLLFRDELIGLLATWDKQGHEPDRAFWLESWNGYGSITTDRIGRGTIHTENLCISLVGGIQPTKLFNYIYQAIKGHENDGLLQRLQLLVYPDEPKDWKLVDKYPDTEAKNRAFEIIRKLADMDFTAHGAICDLGEKIPYFRFAPDAQKVFNEWLTDLERNKLRNDDESIIIEHLGKYRSLMPSLALIIHLIDVADGKASGAITLHAAEQAAAWCDYLESHARRIYGMVTSITVQATERLARKIQKGVLKDEFTVRDVYRKQWGLLDKSEVVQAACQELVEANWLREQATEPGFQQRAKTTYEINPKVKSRG